MLLAAMMTATAASAHPVDEVVQGAYLMVAPGRLRLQLEITPGPAVAATVLRVLDADGDHVFSRAERRAFAERVLRQAALSIDGRSVSWRFDQIGVPAYAIVEQQAGTIQLFADAPLVADGKPRRLVFLNAYRPARGPTTTNIFAAPGSTCMFAGQRRSDDGRMFAVTVARR